MVASGVWGTVACVVRRNGNTPALEFLTTVCRGINEKGKDQPQSTAEAVFMQLFDRMANSGILLSASFKHEKGALRTFRHKVKNQQIRFPCFQDGSSWLLTHGFVKKTQEWEESQFRRAGELMVEYGERKKEAAPKSNGQRGRR